MTEHFLSGVCLGGCLQACTSRQQYGRDMQTLLSNPDIVKMITSIAVMLTPVVHYLFKRKRDKGRDRE
jgi:hypothetical protein